MTETHEERIARIEAADEAARKREFLLAMNEELRRAPPESLSVEGMGFKGRVTGPALVYTALGILLFAAIGYMIRDHDLRAVERAQQISAQVAAIAKGQERTIDTLREVAYIMLQDEPTRRAMAARISMPDTLREKMDRGGR